MGTQRWPVTRGELECYCCGVDWISPSPSPCLAVVGTPFTGYPEEWFERGYRAMTSRIRRNESSPLSRIKSCNYLDSILARMEASTLGADEALLLNSSGELACGSSSNVFLVLDDTLVTPPLESGVLDGITRRVVLELATRLGFPHSQRPVRREEMHLAQEVFVTNTAVGIMPVVAVDGRPVGRGSTGPLSARLREAYSKLLTHCAIMSPPQRGPVGRRLSPTGGADCCVRVRHHR